MKLKIGTVLTAAAGGGLFFAVAPNGDKTRRRRLRVFQCRRFAHRGLHDRESGVPENSLAAFEKAADAGYGIELDVRLTKDGIPIVIHDENTMRVCGADHVVADTSFAELRALTLSGSEEKIPSFEEALERINGRVPLIIEVKNGHDTAAICPAVMRKLYLYPGFYCVQSFSPFVLKWFRDHEPNVLRGQLSFDFFEPTYDRGEAWPVKFAASYLVENVLSRPDYIAYDIHSRSSLPLIVNRKWFGTPFASWTVRSRTEMEEADDRGDIVIFEGFLPEK